MHPVRARELVALLVLASALRAGPAFARGREPDETPRLVSAAASSVLLEDRRRAEISGYGYGPGDTAFVGFVPGNVSSANYWGIGVGAFRPYSSNAADYGYWGWDNDALHDNIAEVHGDSLFGWWPTRGFVNATGGLTLSDDNRPWWALDIGNSVNYVINQGAAHGRTYGVVGVWHRDNGSVGGGGVGWAPLGGSTHSLWCGLRRDGDISFVDPITGNAFNARLLLNNGGPSANSGGAIGTYQKFPGYASQWDQMAYRDVAVGGASTMKVRFRFRANMSTSFTNSAMTRTGWFDKDPLEITTGGAAAGNFISSTTAGPNSPVDSFMVYVGAPVHDPAGWLGSDGVTHPVYDPQRRWFAEVLRANEGLYREIFTVAGDQAEQQMEVTGIPLSGFGAVARLVFRSKTNRGFDDETGGLAGNYSSDGKGAVVIDDVEVALDAGSYTTLGDFESASQVDNGLGVSALDAWKTTGKPPGIYHHVHSSLSLLYEDICGPVGAPRRICNLGGNVISGGNHDQAEAVGGFYSGTADREVWDGIVSPAIALKNGGGTNVMGLDAATATATGDYYAAYDIYTGIFDPFTTGSTWRVGFSAWPARSSDGTLCWSAWRYTGILFNPDRQCFQDFEGAKNYVGLTWSAADAEGGDAYPDSIRFQLGKRQECRRFGVNAGCSSSNGCYWDNVSLAIVDAPIVELVVSAADWISDAFPVNGLDRANVPLLSAAFDTTTALVKCGRNIAQTTNSANRYAIPGDTTVVYARGPSVRIDLVFRISPGPGNYRTAGNRGSGLRRVPTDPTTAIDHAQTGPGQAFETNFWAQYLHDNGARGTPGGHPAGATNGGRDWSPLVWNSARCDTAEMNLWPHNSFYADLDFGAFATAYSEADPRYLALGIEKNRCFVQTPASPVNSTGIRCDIALTNGWPTTAGYVAEAGRGGTLPLGHTYEYTKILPDGQFTPGTHVEYFFRREDSPIGYGPFLVPDTSVVTPQLGESSTDGHRWQQFSVLPDAWKKAVYGGLGPACLLYVDLDDGGGDERAWVSIADTIGATASVKYGAHNGWHARGDADVNDPAGFVRDRNAQPGTTWDMFGVRGVDGFGTDATSLGSTLSNHSTGSLVDYKWSFQGPSLQMLESFYPVLLLQSGRRHSGLLGPHANNGSDDHQMLKSFLLGGTNNWHRGLMIQGDGFVESEAYTELVYDYLGVDLRSPSYLALSGAQTDCADLSFAYPISEGGFVLGVRNTCINPMDVLDLNPASDAIPSAFYSPSGFAGPPLVASVFQDVDPVSGRYWQSLVDGWGIAKLNGRYCTRADGRIAYACAVFGNVFGKICQIAGTCITEGDVPNRDDGRVFVDFMDLRNNPLLTGSATIEFGLAAADRVEIKVYDVAGRVVRVIADRTFAPGNYALPWDGADQAGRALARGVYFTQVRYVGRGFTSARKLTLLR